MIKVSGQARLVAEFEVELDMTEEEFDALSERQVNELLEGRIDWYEVCQAAEVDEIDVWELEEVEEK